LNFLWLNLDLPAKPGPEDGSIRRPVRRIYRHVRDTARAILMLTLTLYGLILQTLYKAMGLSLKWPRDGMLNVHMFHGLMLDPRIQELYSRAETKKELAQQLPRRCSASV